MDTAIDIKTFRTERSWSQEKLADELSVNVSTVWRWEKGISQVKGPVAKALQRLAEEHPVASSNEAA